MATGPTGRRGRSGGQDSFWLKTGNGIDQVRDFEDGIDRILLEDGKTFE